MFSAKELAECAYEELQKRRNFYPKWVREKKMTQAQADERINKMEAIYRVLIRLPEDDLKAQG